MRSVCFVCMLFYDLFETFWNYTVEMSSDFREEPQILTHTQHYGLGSARTLYCANTSRDSGPPILRSFPKDPCRALCEWIAITHVTSLSFDAAHGSKSESGHHGFETSGFMDSAIIIIIKKPIYTSLKFKILEKSNIHVESSILESPAFIKTLCIC